MISLQFFVISTWKTTYFTYPTGLCNFLVWKIYLCLYNKCPFKSFYYLYLLFTVHNLHMLFYEKEAVQKLR